jgi:hypothetical protein
LTHSKFDILEDLALKDGQESESYKHVVEAKGEDQVLKRMTFLELSNV